MSECEWARLYLDTRYKKKSLLSQIFTKRYLESQPLSNTFGSQGVFFVSFADRPGVGTSSGLFVQLHFVGLQGTEFFQGPDLLLQCLDTAFAGSRLPTPSPPMGPALTPTAPSAVHSAASASKRSHLSASTLIQQLSIWGHP